MKKNGISIFYNHVRDFAEAKGLPVDAALAATREMGFDGCAFDIFFLPSGERPQLKKLYDSTGLEVSTVWSEVDFLHWEAERCWRQARDLLECADFFGTGNVLVLPGVFKAGDDEKTGLAKIYAGLETVCRMAGKFGIAVTIEDFGMGKAPNGNIAGCADFLRNVDGLKFAFDTGNFTLFGEEPHAAYEVFKDKIAYVHLKDKKRPGDVPAAVGDGDLDLGGLMRRMVADGYTGGFAAEHFGLDDQETAMRHSASFCRKVLS